MNILKQAKDEEFVKEQFVKGRILDDTKDYGRTQFVDEIYRLQQENQRLKDEYKTLEENWNKLKEIINIKLYNTEYLQKLCGCKIDEETHIILDIIKKDMQELERGVSDVED